MCTLSSQVNEWGSMTGPLTLPELRSHKTPYSFIFSCKSWARILKCYCFLLHKVGAAETPHFAEEKRKVQRVMISPRPRSGVAAEPSGKTQVSSLMGEDTVCGPGSILCASLLTCWFAQLLSRVRLCEPRNCSPPGSSVHGISQARILEWVAISFSRGSSQPRDQTCVSCTAGGFFTPEPPGKLMLPLRSKEAQWPFQVGAKPSCIPDAGWGNRNSVIILAPYDTVHFLLVPHDHLLIKEKREQNKANKQRTSASG